MSTHADKLRAAEQRVIDAAVAHWNATEELHNGMDLDDDVVSTLDRAAFSAECDVHAASRALLALRAATCPECKGHGQRPIPYETDMGVPGERWIKCDRCKGTGSRSPEAGQ